MESISNHVGARGAAVPKAQELPFGNDAETRRRGDTVGEEDTETGGRGDAEY